MNRQHLVDFLGFAHGMVVNASTWPDDKVTAQAAGQPNHCLWTLGHLASTYEWASGLIDGRPTALPDSYKGLFGMGSTPTGEAKGYPPIAEVRGQFDAVFNRLMASAKGISDAELDAPLSEATGGFASTKMDMLYKMAWHDGWHLGQLTTLRKHLGLPGIF
jgi:hypothetical protein